MAKDTVTLTYWVKAVATVKRSAVIAAAKTVRRNMDLPATDPLQPIDIIGRLAYDGQINGEEDCTDVRCDGEDKYLDADLATVTEMGE